MNLTNVAIRQFQDAPFPDVITRPAIDSLVTEARRRLDKDGPHDEAAFAAEMARRAIAEHAPASGSFEGAPRRTPARAAQSTRRAFSSSSTPPPSRVSRSSKKARTRSRIATR